MSPLITSPWIHTDPTRAACCTPHSLRFIAAVAVLAVTAIPMPVLAADETSPVHQPVTCQGAYRHHLQGVCSNEKKEIFWSFTTTLVKTSRAGEVLKKTEVGNHHGDLCHVDGKLYVAVNFGKFNDPQGNADSWVYVYDADDLSLLGKHPVPQVIYGAGGMDHRNGRFYVVGGLPTGFKENYVYEYDAGFKFQKRHVIASGHTLLGIQTAAFAHNRWYFGCYGTPAVTLVTDADFQGVTRHAYNCSLGIAPFDKQTLLSASGSCDKVKGCIGRIQFVKPDDAKGLAPISNTP